MHKVAVIGSGLMGSGIALCFSMAGYNVSMMDIDETILRKSIEGIRSSLDELKRLQVIKDIDSEAVVERITTTTSIKDAVKDVFLVTEAVPESMELKRNIFRELDILCDKEVILCSNTSSFKISEIADATMNRERVIGTHWWNPPYLMPLVEIIRTEHNSDLLVKRLVDIFKRDLKKEVVVLKDSPGGVGVRLQASIVAEAARILDEELITPEELDKIVRLTLGLRFPFLGPLQIADLGGLDVFVHANQYLADKLGERFKPSKKMIELVNKGELGAKSGKGFYNYSEGDIKRILARRNEMLVEILKLQQRLSL